MKNITIQGREIGDNQPVYIVAELSANHNQDIDEAMKLIRVAKEIGADAIKIQTYTPDTITLDCNADCFWIKGTVWEGKRLYDLYGEAFTPWDWQPRLKKAAEDVGLPLFSSPFDETAVDFLEDLGVPAFKIASFELVDTPLIRRVAATGKPIIMSTGMATMEEITEAVAAARSEGAEQIALLKCVSAYPAPPEEMNLATIPHLADTFGLPVGISDHTLTAESAVAAVALGARIVEKHLTMSRDQQGPDSEFSLEPDEFRAMVDAIRTVELAVGTVQYGPSESELSSIVFRRSLFVVEDVKRGEAFSTENVRSIRPGHGLSPSCLDRVIGMTATRDIERGTPLRWEDIDDG